MSFASTPQSQLELIWSPQAGPQEALVNLPPDIDEVLFGGSRGGGKTDSAIALALIRGEKWGKKHHAIFFRRELTQLDAVITRAREIGEAIGWEYKEISKTLTSQQGATIKFRHLERDSDAEKYQGWSVQLIIFEEMTNFPDPKPLMKLKGILRSAHGVPCLFLGTANPGGPGHSWVKRRYIDPVPNGWKPIEHTDKISNRVSRRVYIPSRLTDNKKLTDNDPGYLARLAQTGSEQLVRAWVYGLWDIVDGAFFDEFDSQKHVLKKCNLPGHWMRFRAGDWGSAKPFAFYWMAVASEHWTSPCGKMIPRGAIVVYREHYGIKIDPETGDFVPNEGLRLYAEVVGKQLAEMEAHEPSKVAYGVLDPSAFSNHGGPSIRERIYIGSGKRIMFREADNKRVAGRGAMGGWDQVRARLAVQELSDNLSAPMVFFTDACVHLIRTLPMVQHDKDNVEDIDTEAEDHALDALRYGLMSRPYMTKSPIMPKEMTTLADKSLNELWDEEEAERARSHEGQRI